MGRVLCALHRSFEEQRLSKCLYWRVLGELRLLLHISLFSARSTSAQWHSILRIYTSMTCSKETVSVYDTDNQFTGVSRLAVASRFRILHSPSRAATRSREVQGPRVSASLDAGQGTSAALPTAFLRSAW